MSYLYLLLDIGSISVPLFYSIYEKKFHFIQYIKPVLTSILITATIFLIWDIWFTKIGVWGFNSDYLIGLKIFQLPLEEWMFFICIPYASIFTHEVLKYFFPNISVSSGIGKFITLLLIIATSTLAIYNSDKWYTFINLSFFSILLLVGYIINKKELFRFYITYLVVLIPFFIVNGILTGSFIEDQVVWYNNHENLGIRIGTIPVEDVFYGFSMIFTSVLIFHKISKTNQ